MYMHFCTHPKCNQINTTIQQVSEKSQREKYIPLYYDHHTFFWQSNTFEIIKVSITTVRHFFTCYGFPYFLCPFTQSFSSPTIIYSPTKFFMAFWASYYERCQTHALIAVFCTSKFYGFTLPQFLDLKNLWLLHSMTPKMQIRQAICFMLQCKNKVPWNVIVWRDVSKNPVKFLTSVDPSASLSCISWPDTI